MISTSLPNGLRRLKSQLKFRSLLKSQCKSQKLNQRFKRSQRGKLLRIRFSKLSLNKLWSLKRKTSQSIWREKTINAVSAEKSWLSLASSHVVTTSAANASNGPSLITLLVLFAERTQDQNLKLQLISNSKNSSNKLTPMSITS